jgi:hypothetical protein
VKRIAVGWAGKPSNTSPDTPRMAEIFGDSPMFLDAHDVESAGLVSPGYDCSIEPPAAAIR